VLLLGIVLLVLGWLIGIHLLVVLGLIALVVGLALLVAGASGRAIGGRRYWY
jgi:Family of unknown function (DUF6131)